MTRPRSLAVVLAVVLAIAPLAGCGRDAVDRDDEARALELTCRSIQERSTGRPARPIDRTVIDRFLASEPGSGGDRSAASVVRQLCAAASRSAASAEGARRDGAGGPWGFPSSGPGRP